MLRRTSRARIASSSFDRLPHLRFLDVVDQHRHYRGNSDWFKSTNILQRYFAQRVLGVAPADMLCAHHGISLVMGVIMKTRTIVCALAATSLSLGSLSSFAQGYDRDRDQNRDNNRYQQRDDNRRDGERQVQRGDERWQRDHDRRAMGNRAEEHYYYGARGPEWRRGGHIPPEYRSRQYVVNDWRAHHLHAPPRGYQWVQVGSDYVLVAVATGIIAQLLLNQ
jgi:Ni/Co efflux regulator RcnB